jgi:hypothetical protein
LLAVANGQDFDAGFVGWVETLGTAIDDDGDIGLLHKSGLLWFIHGLCPLVIEFYSSTVLS